MQRLYLSWKGTGSVLATLLMLTTVWSRSLPRRLPKRNRPNPCRGASSQHGREPEPRSAGYGYAHLTATLSFFKRMTEESQATCRRFASVLGQKAAWPNYPFRRRRLGWTLPATQG